MELIVTKHSSHNSYQMKISDEEMKELMRLLTEDGCIKYEHEMWNEGINNYRFSPALSLLRKGDEVAIYDFPDTCRVKPLLERFAEKTGRTLVLKEKFGFCP